MHVALMMLRVKNGTQQNRNTPATYSNRNHINIINGVVTERGQKAIPPLTF